MDKKNVMKALSLCGTGSETCTGCPYYAMNGCDRHMCDDALTLLKADEKANEKPAYYKEKLKLLEDFGVPVTERTKAKLKRCTNEIQMDNVCHSLIANWLDK